VPHFPVRYMSVKIAATLERADSQEDVNFTMHVCAERAIRCGAIDDVVVVEVRITSHIRSAMTN
jgi:hypothetical protein